MAGALPTTRQNFSYTYDTALVAKNSGAITASGALDATGGSASPIVDVGAGFVRGDLVIDVTALLATASNGVEIYLQGTATDSTFGTDTNIVELAVYPLLGDVAARRTDANKADDAIGRFVLPFRNERGGQVYRYLRVYTLVVASGTVTYKAFIGLDAPGK